MSAETLLTNSTENAGAVNTRNRFIFIALFCCVAFFVLGTTLNLGGLVLPLNVAAIGFIFLISMIGINFYTFIRENFQVLAFFVVLMLSFGFYSALIEQVMFHHNQTRFELGFLRISINNCVMFFIGMCLIYLFKKFNLDRYELLKMFFYVSVLNSALILFSFINQDFRVALESILFQSPTSNINYMELDWRLRGIAAGGGASLSMFNAFSVMCGVLLTENKRVSPTVFLFGSLIITASCIVIARTGLMVSLAILSFWIFLNLLKPQRQTMLPLIAVFSIFIALVISYIDVFMRVIPWALEIFLNILDGRGASSKSTNELFSMFDIPDQLVNLLLGFGFIESSVEFRSDSGYVKTMYAVGALAAFALYALIFFILFKYPVKQIEKGKVYWILFATMLVFTEIKEPFMYQNYLGRALLLFVLFFSPFITVGRRNSANSIRRHN